MELKLGADLNEIGRDRTIIIISYSRDFSACVIDTYSTRTTVNK